MKSVFVLCALLLISALFSRADSDIPPVDVSPSEPAPSAPPPPQKKTNLAPANPAPPANTEPVSPSVAPSIETSAPPPPRPQHTLSPSKSAQPSGPKTEGAPPASSKTFATLDFPFLEVMTKTNAPDKSKLDQLSEKISSLALPDRLKDVFDNSPNGTLVAKQLSAPIPEKKTSEPVVDLFLQSVRSLQVEMIDAQENMAVVNDRDLYVGDTVIMQTGAFTTQATVKEIKPTTVVFENPVDHQVTSITLPTQPDSLQEIPQVKPETLEDIDGITLQERR